MPSTIPTPELLAALRKYEGLELTAYPDPLTHADPWTIGYGHTGSEVHPGLTITLEQAEQLLFADAASAIRQAIKTWPWVVQLDPVRFDAMAQLVFNMGTGRLSGFKQFLAAMVDGDHEKAAAELIDSRWYHQVNGNGRGDYIVNQVRG